MAEITTISPQAHAARNHCEVAASNTSSWTGGGIAADDKGCERGKATIAEESGCFGGGNASCTNKCVTSGVNVYRNVGELRWQQGHVTDR